MDSKAKIGLLAGLVFVFIAAFAIDAIIDRNYSRAAPEAVRVEPYSEPRPTLEVVDPEPKIADFVDHSKKRNRKPEQKIVDFPEIVGPPASTPADTVVLPVADVSGESVLPATEVLDEQPIVVERPVPKPTKPRWPKNYVVQPGDHLTAIAMTFYGCSDTHSYPYVQKLFRANRSQLDSPDDLFVGQALVIPAPNEAGRAAIDLADESNSEVQPPQKKLTEARAYIVQSGDNLADIAKKFYGAQAGNRTSVIRQLFRVNRPRLKSPHLLNVGQKLTIPPLSSLTTESVVQRLNPGRASGSPEVSYQAPGRLKKYTVRKGDSLWSIAANNLGNALLYQTIAQLNASLLDNANHLKAGMQLHLPNI